ncbi:hypothetical protein F53441_951 [Fusarium austroafricanum]|uniref:Uncharacterized protein n=1 Tax=Fusarium austroafricanum TaxID=2364996 RepID=A0A8H4P5M7_9HYPO|nr:hypothetical protein F53441_951 [Fusarium austroafricanum]
MLPSGVNPVPLDDETFTKQASEQLQHRLSRLRPKMLEPSTKGILGVNASDRSRSSLSPAVMQLFDAPVYRLQLSCSPSKLQSISIKLPDEHDSHLRFLLEEAPSLFGPEQTIYQASFGPKKSILSNGTQDDANDTYSVLRYPLISFNQAAFWIGSIQLNQSGDGPPRTATQRWGELIPFSQSAVLSQGGTQDRHYNLTLSGLTCQLNRSTGWANVKVNGSNWSILENTLVNENLVPRPDVPMLSLASALDVFDDGSVGRAPGLGGHLLRAAMSVTDEGSHPDWKLETLADAFLWYEMESRSVLLDNDQAGRAERYKLQSNIDDYTMTFIPWILLSGLITLGVACGLTIGLSIDSWKVYSLRSGRLLDSIRLTADVGVALDKKVFEECSTWHGTRLNKCADEARFRYEANTRLNSETGLYSIGIRLRQISRPHD